MHKKWLSLDERIELALNYHLTRSLDRRPVARGTLLEWLPYTKAYMGKHLVLMHAGPDLSDIPGRHLAAISLCLKNSPGALKRKTSLIGAAEHLLSYFAKRIGRSGKFFITGEELGVIDRPERIFYFSWDGKRKEPKGWYGKAGFEHNGGNICMVMEGLVRWYLVTGDRKAKETIARAIKGSISNTKSIRVGENWFIPNMMTPLVLYLEATGDEIVKKALDELADYFVSDICLKYFPDGMHTHGYGVGHLHLRMGTIAGFARYAKLTGRTDYLAAAERLFAANVVWGTEFGYMPERHVYSRGGSDSGNIWQPWVLPDGKKVDFSWFTRPRHGWDTCEICVTADAIDAAIVLAESGYEEYWDVAERYTNHLFRAQITDTSFFIEREKKHPPEILGATFENVREAVTGAFYSASTPTHAMLKQEYGKPFPGGGEGVREGAYYDMYTACCPGWGCRTLGLLRDKAVKEEGSRSEVNLPYDRKSANVEVRSFLPFEGKIRVRAVRPVELFVRIPDWVEHDRVEVRVSGKRRNRAEFKNSFSDYVRVGRLKAGEKAEVVYPLRREKKRYHMEYHPCLYEADWLGNYVTGMREIGVEEPEGENTLEGFGPLYP